MNIYKSLLKQKKLGDFVFETFVYLLKHKWRCAEHLRQTGEWLRRAGFDIGDDVLVTMETNRLTIDFEKSDGD
jgi:hypothetical protein